MNTNVRWIDCHPRPWRGWLGLATVGLLLAGPVGCGPQAGAILYFLGSNADQKVKAEFKIPPGPVLILVDDELDLVQPPIAREALVDQLATQLKEHKIAERVTTNEEIGLIRRSASDFDHLSIREVARRANADTVIWMNVEDFFVEDDLELMVTPARLAVKLKVFNAKEEDKHKMRLWPPDRDGRLLSLSVDPHKVHECKNRAEVHQLVASQMADKVAKLFYDYTIPRE